MKEIVCYSVFLLLLFSCSDSDDAVEVSNKALLPKVIKTEAYGGIPDLNFYTDISTFSYDDMNRPTAIFHETYYREKEDAENSLLGSVSRKIEYRTDNTIIETIERKYSGSTTTTIKEYIPDTEDISIINIIIDNDFKETIELDNGFALKYKGRDFVKEYQYNENNEISQYFYLIGSYSSTTKYEYDNKKGVFESMNVPQWLFISLFNEEGYANNIEKIYYLFDNKFQDYATFKNEYNAEKYPIKRIFVPSPGIDGLSGRNTTIEYIPAKVLSND